MNKIILKIKILFCSLIENPSFIIQIESGEVTKVKGVVKNSFMTDCIEIVKLNDLKSGLIYAVNGKYGKPILKVSSEISKDVLQQLRNTWGYNS